MCFHFDVNLKLKIVFFVDLIFMMYLNKGDLSFTNRHYFSTTLKYIALKENWFIVLKEYSYPDFLNEMEMFFCATS